MYGASAVAAHDAVVQAIAEVNISSGVPGGAFDKGHDTHGTGDSRCKQLFSNCLVNLTDLPDQCTDHDRCLAGPEGTRELTQGLINAVEHAGCLQERKQVAAAYRAVFPMQSGCGCNRVASDGRIDTVLATPGVLCRRQRANPSGGNQRENPGCRGPIFWVQSDTNRSVLRPWGLAWQLAMFFAASRL